MKPRTATLRGHVSSAEAIACILGIGGALVSAFVAAFRVGEVSRAFKDLSARHADFAKETREGRGTDGGRISALELARAGDSVKLDAIQVGLAELRTLVSERMPAASIRRRR